jgi:hypothetical protein
MNGDVAAFNRLVKDAGLSGILLEAADR